MVEVKGNVLWNGRLDIPVNQPTNFALQGKVRRCKIVKASGNRLVYGYDDAAEVDRHGRIWTIGVQ